jgi:hypothetical protein
MLNTGRLVVFFQICKLFNHRRPVVCPATVGIAKVRACTYIEVDVGMQNSKGIELGDTMLVKGGKSFLV